MHIYGSDDINCMWVSNIQHKKYSFSTDISYFSESTNFIMPKK